MHPEKISLDDLDLLTRIIKILLKDTAKTFVEITKDKASMEKLNYFLGRLRHYHEGVYSTIIEYNRMFKEIMDGTFHLKNYPILRESIRLQAARKK